MASQLESQHAATVAGFVRGDQQVTSGMPLGRAIAASWRRCMTDYAIDPEQERELRVLDSKTLEEHRDRHEQLIQVASAEID